ncbi:hypothetical protein D1610_11590 [Sphingomonas gilva]|uniref:Uncharacterized protein n=1 Tax=Sphingomonas gilva TaxID=2305907 RepID=A0A396S1D2_9SPHN|nr:hypothetical protein [Sphingomonas gilva]RHW17185.1 hypothetical protein D1610_11590 [Sphingomonas gilva]
MSGQLILRLVAGPFFGAGLASIAHAALPAQAAAPSFGPPLVIVFGFDVPVLSAIFGLIGVLLARRVAPASAAGAALGRTGNAALTGLLVLGVLALIVSGEKRPIVALGWAIGLGYSGLGFIELVARSVVAGARIIIDAFVAIATKGAAAWAERRGEPK